MPRLHAVSRAGFMLLDALICVSVLLFLWYVVLYAQGALHESLATQEHRMRALMGAYEACGLLQTQQPVTASAIFPDEPDAVIEVHDVGTSGAVRWVAVEAWYRGMSVSLHTGVAA